MTRPDHQSVRGAIALATRAPSVHNTQPWQWLIGDSSVHLMADRSRHLPATDPDGRDLLISCGAALHHLRVALAALGWTAQIHRIPNAADPDHLAAVESRQHVPSEEDITLAATIPKRRTDRRRYSSRSVPAGHLDLMMRLASAAGALLVPVTEPDIRNHMVRSLAEAADRQDGVPGYAVELTIWSGRGHLARDGVLSTSAPGRAVSYGDTPMRRFSNGTLLESTVEDWRGGAGELLVLATTDDDPRSRLRAGEAISTVLLAATTLGLASCPLSQAMELPDTRAAVADQVLDGAAVPQLVLRVGWPPAGADPLPQSPRRQLEDVIGFLPGLAPRDKGR